MVLQLKRSPFAFFLGRQLCLPGHGPGDAVRLENAVCCGPSGVDDSFRDAFVVEVGDLLPQMEILQQGRAAAARFQGVIGVREADALGGGEEVTGGCAAGAVGDGCAVDGTVGGVGGSRG